VEQSQSNHYNHGKWLPPIRGSCEATLMRSPRFRLAIHLNTKYNW
jgi:hypothetical protein